MRDGLEHEFVKDHWEDHDDKCNAYSRVSRSLRDGGPGYIVIDDSTVINRWGFTRRAGESKQVWLERVAAEKRRTAERIVEWYENGWEWFGAVAEYGDYLESVWGIDDEKYALETAETEMRGQVADRMEQDGYIITDQPEPQPGYSPVDAMRHRIRHQLAG